MCVHRTFSSVCCAVLLSSAGSATRGVQRPLQALSVWFGGRRVHQQVLPAARCLHAAQVPAGCTGPQTTKGGCHQHKPVCRPPPQRNHTAHTWRRLDCKLHSVSKVLRDDDLTQFELCYSESSLCLRHCPCGGINAGDTGTNSALPPSDYSRVISHKISLFIKLWLLSVSFLWFVCRWRTMRRSLC